MTFSSNLLITLRILSKFSIYNNKKLQLLLQSKGHFLLHYRYSHAPSSQSLQTLCKIYVSSPIIQSFPPIQATINPNLFHKCSVVISLPSFYPSMLNTNHIMHIASFLPYPNNHENFIKQTEKTHSFLDSLFFSFSMSLLAESWTIIAQGAEGVFFSLLSRIHSQ